MTHFQIRPRLPVDVIGTTDTWRRRHAESVIWEMMMRHFNHRLALSANVFISKPLNLDTFQKVDNAVTVGPAWVLPMLQRELPRNDTRKVSSDQGDKEDRGRVAITSLPG